MNNRKTRSAAYQQLFHERIVASELLESFAEDDGVYKRLNPFAYNDDIAELEEELKKEFWRIVETELTERQRDVIKLSCQGLTQIEIAKELNVNQSSVTKSIHGNTCYSTGKLSYGGSLKKIKKIVEDDEAIQKILKKINDLREEDWKF